MGERDHPELLLAEISTNFLEISAMHCKFVFVASHVHYFTHCQGAMLKCCFELLKRFEPAADV